MSRLNRWAAPAYALALALAATAPLLWTGDLLLRDAVSTPRSYLSDEALGLGESAPRALPQDFALALTSQILDGGLVVKALLLAGLWLAGWGAARLAQTVVPEAGLAGQLVAATVAVWNPFVAERMLQGQWSLLVGYGCLPWVAAAMLRLGDPDGGSWWAVAFWMALAGLTPTGLMLAATVAVVCAAASRCWWGVAGGMVIAMLAATPWLTATALGTATAVSPEAGVAAFAPRAEPGLGVLGSLAGLGGIWNADAVPASRTTFFAVAGTAVLLGVVALGAPALRRRPAAIALLVLAAAAVVLPTVLATGAGQSLLDAVLRATPGLGVVRDGQKWVALAMPGYAVAGAAAVVSLGRWVRPAVAAVGCAAAVLAALPDLAWGVGGQVVAVRYPPGWAAAARVINADPRPVAVLPADVMRRFGWAGPAPVLDPLPRWVRAQVLSTGDLTISGRSVPGEGGRARDVQRLLLGGADPAALARAGVGWVVVESNTSGEAAWAARTLGRLPVWYRDADITVYRVGGDSAGASAARRAVMVSAHLVWLAVLVGGAVGCLRRSRLRSGR